MSGGPIEGLSELHAAALRIMGQYPDFEWRVLAVRGESLCLMFSRWSDNSGNETTNLDVIEVGPDNRITYEGRFDEDDFTTAFEELERRYYSGEGAPFAESGNTAAQVMAVGNNGDLDKLFNELAAPGLRVESRAGTIFPDRTPAELRESVELFQAMVASSRIWYSAVRWLSPECAVVRQEREAVGKEGERYEWSRIYVAEFEHGLYTAICDFDVEFEEQAFAYAEERVRVGRDRLAVRNRATDFAERLTSALQAGDIDRLFDSIGGGCAIDDRRRLAATSADHSSNPNLLNGQQSFRKAVEVILSQFAEFEMTPLAVRGERLALCVVRSSDESGNESTQNFVFELSDDDRPARLVYFDEDNFEGAYRELEERYYSGEGVPFAEPGMVIERYVATVSRGDLDTLFDDVCTPDVRVATRSHSVLLDRSVAELRSSLEELQRLVGMTRNWFATIRWISPRWAVGVYQREAVGDAGEQYAWSRIVVFEVWRQRLAYACQFEMEDEDAAFAYAEERARASANPLVVSNRASALFASMIRTMDAGDVDAVLTHVAEDYVFDDRRRLSGDPIMGKAALRPAVERILQQFSDFDSRLLAVRGERLALGSSRWSDDAGNQTSYLHVWELNDDGFVAQDIRFDEDDFEGAYRELETRYYADLGDEFEAQGKLAADYVLAANRGDFDTLFGELSSKDLLVKNRSRSFFPDRNAEELRASYEELYAMVPTVRSWFSVGRWMSPTVYIGRLEREGVRRDGERYSWSRILVNEYQDGRAASMCEFDADDDEAALGYAEELARQT